MITEIQIIILIGSILCLINAILFNLWVIGTQMRKVVFG